MTRKPGEPLRLWLDRQRMMQTVERQALAALETFPGTSQGRALPASPVPRGGNDTKIAPVTIRRGGPAGEIIHTSATSDSVASGGDYLTADTEVDRYGFSSNTLGDTYTIPRTASYKIELTFEWDTYQGGGTIEVEVNGTVVRSLSSPDSNGQSCTWSPTFRASKGDTVKVKVTQTSGSAQAATFTITVAVVEPQKAIADPGFTKVASVDAWGIFNDGTSWWTSEGDSGVTVIEYNSSWVQQSTFEASTFDNGRVRGITHDGTDLWLAGPLSTSGTCRIAQYSTAGSLLSSFDVDLNSPGGLAWDGTDLWVALHDGVGGSPQMRRYNTSGTLQQTINLSSTRQGLAVYDGDLVVVNETGNAIEVRNTSGTVLKTIPTSGAINEPDGVWVAADGTMYVSKDGDGVYKWAGSL